MLKRVLLGFLLIFMVSSQGLALYVKTADSVIIPKNVVITDNLFAAGKEVVIDGIVTGNLVAFGEKVTVNGEVGGTVIVGGEDVIVNGVVKMDLFAGGKNLLLAKSSRVGKDVFIGAEKASVAGKIFRDLRIGGSNINIVETAMVKGAVDYATKNMNLSKAAQIKGKIAAHDGPNVEGFKKEIAGSFNDFMVVRRVISILTIFALGLALIFLVPNQVRLINTQMVSHFWQSLGWGLLSVIVIPIVATLLMITVIGLPVSIMLLVAYFFGMYVSLIFSSLVIGKLILSRLIKKDLSPVWFFIFGLALVKALSFVPVLGWLVSLILFLWSFGAIVITRFTSYKEARSAGIL